MFERVIQEEIGFLNESDFKPVLSKIEDDGNNIKFVFRIKDGDDIILTHRDMDIINNDDEIKLLTSLPRDKMVNRIRKMLKKKALVDDDISFAFPLAQEVMPKIQTVVKTLLSPAYFALVDADFLLDSYSPIIAYNIMKEMANNLELVPSEFKYALKRPNEYFNPVEVLHRENAFIFQDSGAICGI